MDYDIVFSLSRTEHSWLRVGIKYFPSGNTKTFLLSYYTMDNIWYLQSAFQLGENEILALKWFIDIIVEAVGHNKNISPLQRADGEPTSSTDPVDLSRIWANSERE